MNLIYIRYVLKITVSCPFNRTAILIPILFINRSLSDKNPLVFLSTFIRSPCTFLSVSNTLHIRSMHVVVYYFYSLLKSAHAGQQFACSRKKDSESYHPDMHSLSACVTCFTQFHTSFFAPVLLTRRSTVRQIVGLVLELLYIQWNGIEQTIPCVIHSASVRNPCDIHSRSVQ